MSQPSSDNMSGSATKNRFIAALLHIDRYNGRYGGVLSKDTGLSTKELRQILRGQREPSFLAVDRIVKALNEFSEVHLPVNELILDTEDSFPTEFICELFDCKCLPPWALEDDGSRVHRFEGVPPGQWDFSVPPFENPN
ncbi:MAG: hypothetical protein H7Y17_13795 [Chlorobia bacterium]|nr:hypothetical protein [Fimbriimonadaceae bacterium]